MDTIKRGVEVVKANKKQLLLSVAAAAEVAGIAYGLGFFRAYYGEKTLLKLPLEAWVAILSHGVGFALDLTAKGGPEGETRRIVAAQFHNIANGALAALMVTMGAEHGAEKLSGKQQQPAAGGAFTGAPAPRQLGPGLNIPMSRQELDTMAANI